MEEFRITLISDPTQEFPDNTNNRFKVRLPTLIDLSGDNWKASLWSLSVPDEGQSSVIIASDLHTRLVTFSFTLTKRKQSGADPWYIGWEKKTGYVELEDVMSSQRSVVSGVQFWNNILAGVEQKVMTDIHTTSDTWKETNGNAATVSLKKEWKPTLTWEKDDLVLEAVPKYDVVTIEKEVLSTFSIHLNLAIMFGFVNPVPGKDNAYTLGPNLHFELPKVTYDSTTLPRNTTNEYPWPGEHYFGIKPQTFSSSSPSELFLVEGGQVHFSRRVQWRFINLNTSFNALVGPPKRTVMVYSDVVESTIVGAQKHPLLREVQLERTGSGRASVEPYHHEWIKLRSNRMEVIEEQIASPDGPLSVLPPGKTILTLGFRLL